MVTMLFHSTVPWALSIEALKAVFLHLNTTEAEQFVDEYLFKVINLMTQQRYALL